MADCKISNSKIFLFLISTELSTLLRYFLFKFGERDVECCVSMCFRENRVRFVKCIVFCVKRFVVQRPDTFLFFMIHVCSVHHLRHIRSAQETSQETEESLHSIVFHLILLSSFSIHCVHIFSCALIPSRTSSSVVFSIAPLVLSFALIFSGRP
jgi:hypothetical protein